MPVAWILAKTPQDQVPALDSTGIVPVAWILAKTPQAQRR